MDVASVLEDGRSASGEPTDAVDPLFHSKSSDRQADASDSASDFNPDRSNSPAPAEPNTLKRKRGRRTKHEVQNKRRLRHPPQFAYIELLNSVIEDASMRKEEPEVHVEEDSNSHGTLWSSDENSTFFRLLARRRQDLPRHLPEVLASKSEIEALNYQQLLKYHSSQVNTYGQTPEILSKTTSPAAFELGQPCCQALDEAADDVALYQLQHELKLEKARYGPYALLTGEIVRELEQVAAGNEPLNESGEHLEHNNHVNIDKKLRDAISLLHVGNWLELTETIFMNRPAAESQSAQETLSEDMDQPTIFATAFVDFYNLAVSLTKRLVYTTLFLKTAKLRAWTPRGISATEISNHDVWKALSTLGVKTKPKNFWRGAARRLNLEVYPRNRPLWVSSKRRYRYNEDQMSYEAVEEKLSGRPSDKSKARTDPLPSQNDIETPEEDTANHSDDMRSENSDDATADGPEALSSASDAGTIEKNTADREHTESEHSQGSGADCSVADFDDEDLNTDDGDEVDNYLESCDRIASTKEEIHISNILDNWSRSSTEMEGLDTVGEPGPSMGEEAFQQRSNWRDEVEFRAEWERYGEPLPKEDFLAVTRIS